MPVEIVDYISEDDFYGRFVIHGITFRMFRVW